MLVGVGGSFCSGKSTLMSFLQYKGLKALSVDEIYRRLLKENLSLQKELQQAFGQDIVKREGVDKKKLKAAVFRQKEGLSRVSSITHKYIIKELKHRLKNLKKEKRIVVVEAPLLFEKRLEKMFDVTILVWAFKKNILLRAEKRGYSRLQALKLLAGQMPVKLKKNLCDYSVSNNGSLAALKHKADDIYQRITKF